MMGIRWGWLALIVVIIEVLALGAGALIGLMVGGLPNVILSAIAGGIVGYTGVTLAKPLWLPE